MVYSAAMSDENPPASEQPPATPEPATTAQQPPPPPPPPAPVERKWIPTLAVLLLVVVTSFGGFVVGGQAGQAVVEPGPDPQQAPIEVVPGVFVQPVSGWEYVGPIEAGLEGGRLTRGNATLDVFATGLEGTAIASAEDLWNAYLFEVLEPAAEQLRFTEQLEIVPVGVYQGVRGYYVGTFTGVQAPVEGEVTALTLDPGVGVIFDGWASEGQLGVVIEEIRAMIEFAQVT